MFKRRIGPDPHAPDAAGNPNPFTPALSGCPDIWELENGDFAVIGIDRTSQLNSHLPQTASCGPDERIVVLPRRILIAAKADIPIK